MIWHIPDDNQYTLSEAVDKFVNDQYRLPTIEELLSDRDALKDKLNLPKAHHKVLWSVSSLPPIYGVKQKLKYLGLFFRPEVQYALGGMCILPSDGKFNVVLIER